MGKDYYKILGIEKSAGAEEIKKAFRRLAHQYHPDKKGGNEDKFKEINEAYQVLGNSEKRQQYDQYGSSFEEMGGFGQGMGWDDFMRAAKGGQGGFSYNFSNFGDLFEGLEDLFGGFGFSSERKHTKRGNDIETEVTLDFREAVFGAEKKIELYKNILCEQCKGRGADSKSKIVVCPSCRGSGQKEKIQRTIFGAFQTVVACPHCEGEGRRAEKECSRCKGRGYYKDQERLTVKIPAGIDQRQTIRFTGKGEPGLKGGTAGDLFITFNIKEDVFFKREGNNILTKLPITFSQAALGDKVEVKTLDGSVKLKIPAGVQSEQIFRLRGKGVPYLRSFSRGDQLVKIVVITPAKLSRREKELFKELGEI